MELKDRVKLLADRKKISLPQLEQELGFGNATIVKWDKSTPKADKLKKVADYFNVSMEYLMDGNIEKPKGVQIPVLGDVAAGIPIEAVEDIIDFEEIDEELASKGEFFGLRIKGNSMSPRIQSGDVVIVRVQSDAESGDIVIAKVNGDDACCKRLQKHDEGISLISLNPEYGPMFFSKKDITDLPVHIIGKVVELRGKF
nr:MAG TPA: Repressor protein CI [Caudoviricetes sp.]